MAGGHSSGRQGVVQEWRQGGMLAPNGKIMSAGQWSIADSRETKLVAARLKFRLIVEAVTARLGCQSPPIPINMSTLG